MGIQGAIERIMTGLFVACVMITTGLFADISNEREAYIERKTAETAQPAKADIVRLNVKLTLNRPEKALQLAQETGPLGSVRTTASMLNKRTCAALECTSIGQSPRGTTLSYYEVDGDWMRVSANNAPAEIWVSRHYVSKIKTDDTATRFAKSALDRRLG